MISMTEIPSQLHDINFRFIRVGEKDKKPLDSEWQKCNNFTFTQVELMAHLSKNGNYGVLCGAGNLIVVDSDTLELNDAMKKLPETFTVKTGNPDINHLHYYFLCSDCKGKVVISKNGRHYGEIQSHGSQVVGPGSIHPNGRYYTIFNDKPIANITFLRLKNAVSELVSDEKFEERIIITTNKSIQPKEMPEEIEYMVAQGCDKGGRDFGTWVLVKKLYALGYDAITINELALRLNKNSKPPRLESEVWTHVRQLLNNPKYLAEKMTYMQLERELENSIIKAPQLRDLESFIEKHLNMIDMAKQFYVKVPFFYDRSRSWWLWNSIRKCWEMVDETDIMIVLDKALNTADRTTKSDVKNEMLEAMKRVGRIHSPKVMPKTWVQCDSTIIDVFTGESKDATPEYFCTNPIPWSLGEKEETPTIDRIFTEWVGEKYMPTLKEIVAYSMLPDYPVGRIFCLVGAGSNGKTCFTNLIVKMLGKENTASSDLDLILSNRFESSKLYKKLVCFIGETNFNTINRSERLKKLTGNDPIGFEFKGKIGFDDYNYAKIIICTNALPITNDRTKGFYRRWLSIKFPNEFTEKKDILSMIPDEEYRNLVKSSTVILKRLLEIREFTNEGSLADREQLYEELSNPIVKFIEINYDKSIERKTLFSEFKDKFLIYLKENKHRSLSGKEISETIAREGYETRRVNIKTTNNEKTTKIYIIGLEIKGLKVSDNDDKSLKKYQ